MIKLKYIYRYILTRKGSKRRKKVNRKENNREKGEWA